VSTEVTVICDGCGKPILPGEEHVQVSAHEVDKGAGITSAPVFNDYHPEHLPGAVTEEVGYEHGSLVGTIIPGADEPMPPKVTEEKT
jgi:hypothetical protein